MMALLNILLSESFWAASLRIATPLIFGVLGALICERAGVLNLGIEGIFVVGAMCGWTAVWLGAGLWGGIRAYEGAAEWGFVPVWPAWLSGGLCGHLCAAARSQRNR